MAVEVVVKEVKEVEAVEVVEVEVAAVPVQSPSPVVARD